MALISLGVSAGWSEPLLVTHTTLLEISCGGSIAVAVEKQDFPVLVCQRTGLNPSVKYFY